MLLLIYSSYFASYLSFAVVVIALFCNIRCAPSL